MSGPDVWAVGPGGRRPSWRLDSEASVVDGRNDGAVFRLERNLARKAMFELDPDRTALSLVVETEDVLGKLTGRFERGELSVVDMRTVMWLQGRYEGGDRYVTFSFREAARGLGLAWGASAAEAIRDSLLRLQETTWSGEMYDLELGMKRELQFSILDVVELPPRRSRGTSEGWGVVRVAFSKFLREQLARGYCIRLERGQFLALNGFLAQRLYVFLESQRGFEDGRVVVPVDDRLWETLGVRAACERRSRARLKEAGLEICRRDGRYREVSLRCASPGRWLLVAEREP
jgi:hypothetical protein